jgi:superfamily II DNA helicase RecQ
VEQALERWPQGKIIVYRGTVAQTTQLREMLDYPIYHSKIGTAERKTEIMKDWLENGQVIIATNTLGVGLDIPDI